MGRMFPIRIGRRDASVTDTVAGDVLELRVHGVNNTTPAALLDLPAEAVRLVAGDKLGSFWTPRTASLPAEGERGHVPAGIVREAYSWGGMVRTVPNFGGIGAAGVVSGVVVRLLYALILPFSIGNAAVWARRLPSGGDRHGPGSGSGSGSGWDRITAGLARLFGLTLTLLFAMSAYTVSVDLIGTQCVARAGVCRPIQGLLNLLSGWSAAQRLALFALGPVLAIIVLWMFSSFSRQRYNGIGAATGASAGRTAALLAGPGFWANRATSHLARAHAAAGLLLTTALVAERLRASGSGGFGIVAVLAAALLAIAALVVAAVPTMSASDEPARWPAVVTGLLLGFSVALLVALLGTLALLPATDAPVSSSPSAGLSGTDVASGVLVATAWLIAVSGVFWRPRTRRRETAWAGCAPAVFMTLALGLGVTTSTVTTVSAANLLTGHVLSGDLLRRSALHIPNLWVCLGTTILGAVVLGLAVVASTLAVPRRFSDRAGRWHAPAQRGDDITSGDAGVLPLSQGDLFDRIAAKRRIAVLAHLAEPIAGIIALLLGAAVALGLVWTWVADRNGDSLRHGFALDGGPRVTGEAAVAAIWALGAVGWILIALLASGATSSAPRPLGIVWDIACYLPRTGQPFGPPCFAERAVPEIAGRIFAWLDGHPQHRVVLAAHSMGGVLAVSALGLLAGSPRSQYALDRVSLLTFGVQLRAFFGRMLPELLGPDPLGTRPSLAPRLYGSDPWAMDADLQQKTPADGQSTDRLTGSLLQEHPVRWVSLWRLSDYLGFPAVSTVLDSDDGTFHNGVDRYAREVDTTGFAVTVATHNGYFRTPEYDTALHELAGLRKPAVDGARRPWPRRGARTE